MKLIKNKLSNTLPMLFLQCILLMWIPGIFVFIIQNILSSLTILHYSPVLQTASMYFAFIYLLIALLLWCTLTKKNKFLLEHFGPHKHNHLKSILFGLFLGFATNAICVLVAYLSGSIQLTFLKFEILPLLMILITVIIQSSYEEFLTRGFLYERLRLSYRNPLVAIIGNSLLFTILHLFNPGIDFLSIMNIFLVGILFSLIVYYHHSLWLACAWHAGWNFTQNIIFGLPNSGLTVPYSLFTLSKASNNFSYNINFGIEGTLFCSIILGICILIVLFKNTKFHF